MLNSLYGVDPDQLQLFIGGYFPAYRGRQLLNWVYGRFVCDPELMTDLPREFKDFIKTSFDLSLPCVNQRLQSSDGSVKLRLELADAAQIETVLIPEGKKLTLCLSSQVGCARACAFCATGSLKLKRNLAPHEIVQQILLAGRESGRAPTNLVFMGMGEPLDNLESVLEAVRLIQHERTLAFSPRRTTVSTCGIVPGIHRLADSGAKIKLAVSLNSAIDATRSELMPVNRKYPLPVLKQALLYYQRKSPFRITLEYILIPEVNMDATALAALRKFSGDLSCKINFIPYNEVPDLPYRAPTQEETEAFLEQARSLPQAIMLRQSRGRDIQGACGQLAASHKQHKQGGSA